MVPVLRVGAGSNFKFNMNSGLKPLQHWQCQWHCRSGPGRITGTGSLSVASVTPPAVTHTHTGTHTSESGDSLTTLRLAESDSQRPRA